MPRRPHAPASPSIRRRALGRRSTPHALVPSLAAAALLFAAGLALAQTAGDPTRPPWRTGGLRGNLEDTGATPSPFDETGRAAAPTRPRAAVDTETLDATDPPPLESIPPTPGTAPATPGAAGAPAAGAAATPLPTPAPGRPATRTTGAAPTPLRAKGPVDPQPRSPSVPDGGPAIAAPATEPVPRDALSTLRQEIEPADEGLEPLGLRTGSFLWLPALELSAGRTTNVAGKHAGPGATLWQVSPELLGRSDWSRHDLRFELRGSRLVDADDHDYDRPSFRAALRGRIDLGEEMRVDVGAGWSRERQTAAKSDDPTSTAVGADLATRTATLGLTRDIGLVALTLRGDVERADYSGGLTTGGTPLGSEAQNNTRWTGALRATLGPTGGLRPFVEVRSTRRTYDEAVVSGSPRDATGRAGVVGVVADLGPMLRGELATGWGSERPDHGSLPQMAGWLLDGSLIWSPDRLTSVKLEAKTAFEPTTLAAATGSLARTVAVTVERSLRRDLVASLGASLTTRGFVGLNREERDVILSSGLTWKVDRNLQTFVKGSFERFSGSLADVGYDTAVVMVGVRLQR
ncbi:hypothetical protein EYW49_03220 [Siculibacillus lacustris]|uniref:Outer membrane beta-barrel protein n=1 Tax=Siculibacillus lacustris TaxID=1549641 RepID=A0A4Q9VWN9_9HYPH|nr:outer membrane beta-barrel protein [Siculibacillus lacustris]TBW40750.1 hypothetical protein EYW49_03220 [Siculibacillus lacustris]